MELDRTGSLETHRPEGEAERRYQELLALSRVSAALSGLWDLDAILRVALNDVLKIMNGDIGGILLLDEHTKRLSYHVHRGLSPRYVEEMHMSLGEGIAGSVAKSGKSILLEDISADPRAARPDLVSTEGIKAFISVPLRAKDKVLGVINVASRMPHHFTTNDMYLLHSIGDQLGVAIEQARLYEWLRKGREEIAKLEQERNRFLRFIAIAAHDLKAPLTAIQGFLWVMLGGFAGQLNDKQRNMLERSSLRIKELMNLISDLLDIPRIETGQVVQEMTEVALLEVIKSSCDDLGDLAKQKGIDLRLELPQDLPKIRGSTSRVQQLLTNLLSNAICYTTEGAVTIRVKERVDDIEIQVLDTGIGIPAEDQPHLFEDFFRASNVDTASNTGIKGTGLGLSISKRIVETHGGRIWVESPCLETNTGSKFTFTLPKMGEGEQRH